MGFRVQRTVFNLRFKTGSLLDGLFVQARSISTGEVLTLGQEAEAARSGRASLQDVAQLIRRFTEELVEWDLEFEDGTPTEKTYDSFVKHDLNVVLAITLAWFDAMLYVDDELGKDYSSGKRFPEESIPMELKS